ncbi:hypothetical protein ABBQ38_005735 [Trebouxia sp. C0009 RCD-2024]
MHLRHPLLGVTVPHLRDKLGVSGDDHYRPTLSHIWPYQLTVVSQQTQGLGRLVHQGTTPQTDELGVCCGTANATRILANVALQLHHYLVCCVLPMHQTV